VLYSILNIVCEQGTGRKNVQNYFEEMILNLTLIWVKAINSTVKYCWGFPKSAGKIKI